MKDVFSIANVRCGSAWPCAFRNDPEARQHPRGTGADQSEFVSHRAFWPARTRLECSCSNVGGRPRAVRSLLKQESADFPRPDDRHEPTAFVILVRHAALIFALKTFYGGDAGVFDRDLARDAAAVLAMASVFITSSPLTGATRRGGLSHPGNADRGGRNDRPHPEPCERTRTTLPRVALWYGIFLYLGAGLTARAKLVFMLAGYTVALLGFPVVAAPELTSTIVVSRVQEITIGIICASVVSMLVLPQSVASTIAAQADSWLAAARRLGADVLPAPAASTSATRRACAPCSRSSHRRALPASTSAPSRRAAGKPAYPLVLRL